MPILNIITDDIPASKKVVNATDLKKKVKDAMKALEDKAGMKKTEVWKVVDQKAAKKAKDPTTLELSGPLDPAKSFDSYGIGDTHVIYIKKKGWKPPAAKSTHADKTPKEAPPAPAAPAPPAPPAAEAQPPPPAPAAPAHPAPKPEAPKPPPPAPAAPAPPAPQCIAPKAPPAAPVQAAAPAPPPAAPKPTPPAAPAPPSAPAAPKAPAAADAEAKKLEAPAAPQQRRVYDASDRAYSEEKDLAGLFDTLCQEVINNTPADPKAFLADFLRAKIAKRA